MELEAGSVLLARKEEVVETGIPTQFFFFFFFCSLTTAAEKKG